MHINNDSQVEAPKIVKIVNLARQLARPILANVSSDYLPRGVTPVTELAEILLREYNGWKNRQHSFNQNHDYRYSRLSEIAKGVVEKAAGSADPREVAGEQACYHACLAISHAHTALQQVVNYAPSSTEYRFAVEQLILTHFYFLERNQMFQNLESKAARMQVARVHVLGWLKDSFKVQEV